MKQFFNEKEVTSTLVMDALYCGCRQLECLGRNKVRAGSVGGCPWTLGGSLVVFRCPPLLLYLPLTLHHPFPSLHHNKHSATTTKKQGSLPEGASSSASPPCVVISGKSHLSFSFALDALEVVAQLSGDFIPALPNDKVGAHGVSGWLGGGLLVGLGWSGTQQCWG